MYGNYPGQAQSKHQCHTDRINPSFQVCLRYGAATKAVRTSKVKSIRSYLNAVTFCLQEVEAASPGDTSETRAKIRQGICQGSPLSPTPFNMYTASLPRQLKNEVPHKKWKGAKSENLWDLALFTDDVKIQLTDGNQMQ